MADTNRFQVLIIDDNRDVSVPMSKLLRMNGHEVAVATDGPSGLELARRVKPEIVLCDVGLPGAMNGYGVAEALRADPELRSTFLVAITGFGQEEDRRRAAQAGFDRHMTKPVGIADLLNLFAQISRVEDRISS